MAFGEFALGFASICLGLHQISTGVKRLRRPRKSRRQLAGAPLSVQQARTPSGDIRLRTYKINNLNERIAHLQGLVEEGKRDPAIYEFARRAVNRKCGRDWCVPEKDNGKELKALFKAIRNNVRYTSDISGIDSYQKPRHTLALKTADCLPVGTLILHENGLLRPIEETKEGDRIFDGEGWAEVTNWWHKGEQDLLGLKLNNGSFFRCTEGHRLFRVAGKLSEIQEVLAKDVRVGVNLFQPNEINFRKTVDLSEEEAFLLGAYLSEGSIRHKRVDGSIATISIAGVAEGKGIREKVVEVAAQLNLRCSEQPREIYISNSGTYLNDLLKDCGARSFHKKLPHLNWSSTTAAKIIEGLNADAGLSTSGKNIVFSTTSYILALQYQILQRIIGNSCHVRRVDDHGGLGSHPIYRVTVRSDSKRRPWAKVKSIHEEEPAVVYDIETSSGRFYLPEYDIVVHNCDDYSTLVCASAATLGLPCRFKVIKTKNSRDWNHIYAQVGLPRRNPKKWISLDASVNAPMGWEAPSHAVADSRTFLT